MNDTVNAADMDNSLDTLLNQRFAGKVVRKDLTKLIKEGVPMCRFMCWNICLECIVPVMMKKPFRQA